MENNKIPSIEYKKLERKMVISAIIDEVIKSKGISKKDFAERLNKNPSEISKWLSGDHNFTIDTLVEIEFAFEVEFFKELHKPELCNPCYNGILNYGK